MASVEVTDYSSSQAESVPGCFLEGRVESRVFVPKGSELWSASTKMAAGATVGWGNDHGDQAVYVIDGTIRIDGEECGPGDVVIVESGVLRKLEATTPVDLVQFGSHDPEPPLHGHFGPPEAAHHSVHICRADTVTVQRHPELARELFADSTCRTCRITLFSVKGRTGYKTGSHIHSQDEIIHLLSGELQVGRLTVQDGMGLAVPGNHRYGFQARSDFYFLNYRRDVSSYIRGPGSDPVLETDISHKA